MTVQILPANRAGQDFRGLAITMKPVESVHPYENNPRYNDSAVPYVKNSIQEFGFKVPIIIDEAGSIICGHTRYKAALELGMSHIPCIVASDLTPKQIQAFRLADNKVAEFSSWDFSKLEAEFLAIDDEALLDDLGFDFSLDADVASDTANIEGARQIAVNDQSPEDFQSVENKPLAHKCPRCGFEFDK